MKKFLALSLLIGSTIQVSAQAGTTEVGKITRRVGATQYMGTGYMIDALSMELKEFHSCSGETHFITANHVIRHSKVGDSVSIAYPMENQNYHSPRFVHLEGKVKARDIESDVAIIEFDSKTKQTIEGNIKCSGLNASVPSLNQAVSLRGYPNFSLLPNKLSANIFSFDRNSFLNFSFSNWMVVDQFTERGMSGGILLDEEGNTAGMLFKKLIDDDPTQKPLSLAISIQEIKTKIQSLLKSTPNRSYRYLPLSEEIYFSGMKFREVSLSTVNEFEFLRSIDIGAEGHDIGAEGHDIGAEGHDVGGIIIDKYSYGVQITEVNHTSKHSELRRDIDRDRIIILKQVNGRNVHSIIHLMKIFKNMKEDQEFDISIAVYGQDGTYEGRYLGNKNKEILHEIVKALQDYKDRTKDLPEEIVEIEADVNELAVLIYNGQSFNNARVKSIVNNLIESASDIRARGQSRQPWRNFRTALFRLKSRFNGVRDEAR